MNLPGCSDILQFIQRHQSPLQQLIGIANSCSFGRHLQYCYLQASRSNAEEPLYGLQVLSEPGWCYVVTLAATGGMALAATQAKSLSNPAPGSLPQPGNITQSAALPPVSIATLGYTDPLAASAAEAEADSLGGRLGALSLDRQDPGHVDTAGSTGATTPEGSRTDLSGAGAGKEGEKESQAFDDPLRRPTSLADISLPSRPQGLSSISQLGGDQLALGSSDQHGISTAGLPRRRQSVGLDVGKAGAAAHSLPVFTGFVSHEQLEAVIGNSWQRKAAVKAQSTHWVKMRGPGIPITEIPSPQGWTSSSAMSVTLHVVRLKGCREGPGIRDFSHA